MNNEDLLEALVIISVLESWAYGEKNMPPDWFIEDLERFKKKIKNALLNGSNALNRTNSASTDALMQSYCRGDKLDCEPVKEVMHTMLGTER